MAHEEHKIAQDGQDERQDEARMAPRAPMRAQDGPKEAQEAPRMVPRRPQEGPRWPQGGPRGSQDGPKRDQHEAKMAQHRTRESKLKPRRFISTTFRNSMKINVFEGPGPLGRLPNEAKMAPSRVQVGLRWAKMS